MTARDLATLARHLIYTYPEYYHFFGQKDFKYRDKFTFMNRNPLIFADIGVDGLKTGFIKESGYGIGGERQARRPAAHCRRRRARIGEGARGRGAQTSRLGLQELQAVPPCSTRDRR